MSQQQSQKQINEKLMKDNYIIFQVYTIFAKNQLFFFYNINKAIIINQQKQVHSYQIFPMEATLFTSFGLLLALMLQKKKPKLAISTQVRMTIPPYIHANHHHNTNQSIEKEMGTPEKKKKPKKEKKKLQKIESEEILIYPRISLTQQMVQKQWLHKNQVKKFKSETIGRQIQSLLNYYLEQIETIIPYNGVNGKYRLSIQIPGAVYSDIPIQIRITQHYPEELPIIDIQTHNLHPLQKQKLSQIMKQQVQLFNTTKQVCSKSHIQNQKTHSSSHNKYNLKLVNIDHSHQEQLDLFYLQSYYPFVFNVCVTISQQLFYRPDTSTQWQDKNCMNINSNVGNQKLSNISSTKNPQPSKNKEQLYNKQILQNVVLQILNLDEDEQKNNISNIQKQKPFQQILPKYPNLRGRYKADYEEIQMIGEGGFGSVYRCRHRIDSNIYAIKKMVINYNDPQSRKLQKQVQLLSKLNHPNIVRYHQSWLEDISSVDQLIADMSITDPEEIEQFNKIWKQYSIVHKSDHMIRDIDEQSEAYPFRSQEDSVIFGEDVIFGDYSEYHDIKDGLNVEDKDGRNQMHQQFSQSETSNMSQLPRKHSQIHEFPFKILYIVMEYCGSMTLRDFINKRFDEPNDVKIKLIRGILQGLSYIHSRRMIHRDLKPANIFLIEGINKVKIGDFGLATIGNIQNNPYEAEIIEYSQKTRGVGTSYYRAPEQLYSSSYDQKIDIYSLGIIMLQMFLRFGTSMERHQVLKKVTLTHKLPTDFSNIQNNIEFEEQIQSCISVKPSDRPTVQKLLQTFRNKYFTRLVSLIANPKHFQFYQLINQLFGIKNETNVIMKQNLYKKYLTSEFIKIFQVHRGVLFSPLSLVPVVDFDVINGIKVQASRKQKFLLLSERGVVMQYPSNAYNSWIRYAKQTMKRNSKPQNQNHYKHDYIETSKQMRRYTFEKVSQFIGGDLKSQFSFKEKYVTAFDIAYEKQDQYTPYFLCEMLKISIQMVQTMQLTQRTPPIYLSHSFIFKCLAIQYKVPIINIHKFLLAINDQKFRSMKNNVKIEYMKNFGLDGNISKRIINLMELQFQSEQDFIASFKIKINQQKKTQFKDLITLLDTIEDQIRIISQYLKLFKLNERVKWKINIPPPSTFGIFWNVGPIKGFKSVEEYLPGQQLYNLHLQTSLNPNSEEYQADVSIWSNGQFLENQIIEVLMKCWEQNITTKWYDQNLGEKDLSCRHNIILKKKNQRLYLMLRKNHLIFERGIEKKNSQESKDKQQRQGAFKPKQLFNYEVLKRENYKKVSGFH